MASPNTIVNLTGATDGVSSDETGVNIKRFVCTVEPEFRKFYAGKYGPRRGGVIAPAMLRVSLEGEILGNSGVMAASFTSGNTVANSTAWFGAPTVGTSTGNALLLLEKAVVTADREEGELLAVALDYDAYAGITHA